MLVTVDRDSVCMGDDTVAHNRSLECSDEITLGEFLEEIRSGSFLASIAGGKATWVCQGRQPLALVTQQYRQPWFLVSPETPLREMIAPSPGSNIEFRYWTQMDPKEAFQKLGGNSESLTVHDRLPSWLPL